MGRMCTLMASAKSMDGFDWSGQLNLGGNVTFLQERYISMFLFKMLIIAVLSVSSLSMDLLTVCLSSWKVPSCVACCRLGMNFTTSSFLSQL